MASFANFFNQLFPTPSSAFEPVVERNGDDFDDYDGAAYIVPVSLIKSIYLENELVLRQYMGQPVDFHEMTNIYRILKAGDEKYWMPKQFRESSNNINSLKKHICKIIEQVYKDSFPAHTINYNNEKENLKDHIEVRKNNDAAAAGMFDDIRNFAIGDGSVYAPVPISCIIMHTLLRDFTLNQYLSRPQFVFSEDTMEMLKGHVKELDDQHGWSKLHPQLLSQSRWWGGASRRRRRRRRRRIERRTQARKTRRRGAR